MSAAKLQPDAPLAIADTDRKCRVGLIARDASNRPWGLTARHVFHGCRQARLRHVRGETVGHYREEDNDLGFAPEEAAGQIARFEIDRRALSPEKIGVGVTWPRYLIEEGRVLGATIVSTDPTARMIGTVVEVEGLADIEFAEGHEIRMIGAIVVVLDDRSLLKPGHAGMLLLSDDGEAVGLGLAAQASDDEIAVIASPLRAYLERAGLRPWAPSGAHWSDLSHRAESFLKDVESERWPDLGYPPKVATK